MWPSMSDNSATAPTVAKVLGRRARELRGDRKAELVARAARLAGLARQRAAGLIRGRWHRGVGHRGARLTRCLRAVRILLIGHAP